MRKPKLTRRFVALFLAVLIFFGTLPFDMITNAADTITSGTAVADTPTVDGWKQYFNNHSTKYAGNVFVDKSVFTAEEAKTYFKDDISEKLSFGKDNFGNQNFLVTLSSIASNTEIAGYTAAPTDTMLVLDLSGSMKNSDYVDEMVEGANYAIDLLLKLNKNNRIGVVLYSGNEKTNNAATTSTATTILPLGRYVTDDNYLKATSKDDVLKVGLESSVKTEDTKKKVEAVAKTVAGGTYMQNGIYFAYNQFLSASDKVIPEGNIQAGIKRTPIMVFMGDGAPTIGTTSYNQVETSNIGDGTVSSKELSFLTQLTAAWTKAKVSSMYGTDMRLYTLGIGTTGNQDATDVLNPMNVNSKTAALWEEFIKTNADSKGNVTIKYDHKTLKIPKDNVITDANQRGYVNSYNTAGTAAQIVTAFENIAKDIEKQSKMLQTKYYATLVNTDAEHDGYVSFSDEIGYGMEIKNIKGIYLGKGRLITGDLFAKNMTTGNLTDIDTELMTCLKSRFGISETQARQLLETAIKNGDIAYVNEDNFSNYVSWYAKGDNTYIAPYVQEDDSSAPEDAEYLMKSYIYLEENMMYTLIRIKEDLKTGYQVMEMNLPASMLPMVTYSLEIDGEKLEEDNIISMTCNANEQSPAMLLYEVGLKDSITPYNIQATADGTCSFYTNRWNDDNGKAFTVPKDVPEGLFSNGFMDTTAAHFVPSMENVRYYYTEDTELYIKENAKFVLYKGSELQSGTDYYFRFQYVVKDDKNYEVKTEYTPVSASALTHVKQTENVWYIKKGTPKNFLETDGQTYEAKVKNETDTLAWSLYHQVKEEGYHVVCYLGNNGKLTVSPAQGIKLTKTVTEAVPGADNLFTFQIELSGNKLASRYPALLVKADGTTTNESLAVSDGNMSVTIGAGDTIYISELPTGTKYQVKENYHADYVPTSKNESGIIEEHMMQEINFINTPRGYGSLLISKEVTHQFETVPEALTKKTFPITITFSGETDAIKSIPTPQNVKRTGDGSFAADLAGGMEVLFTNLPEGVEYQVSENLDTAEHKGFTLKNATDDLKGKISANKQSMVALLNEYIPESVSPSLKLEGTKYVDGDDHPADATYQIVLQEVVIGDGTMESKGNPVTIGQIKKDGTYQYDMSQICYDRAASYSYVIYEVEPNDGAAEKPADVAYDKSFALFTIEVTDDDADGKLEVKDNNIRIHQNSAVISKEQVKNSTTTITKDFRNMYQVTTVSFRLKKTVNQEDNSPYDGNITFGLYESASEQTAKTYARTDEDGNATISLHIRQSDYAVKKYYYVRETAPDVSHRVVGMTYDESVKYVITIQWNKSDNEPTVEYFQYDADKGNGVGEKILFQETPVLKINNSYDGNVTSTPAITLSGTKILQGREWNENDKFVFELYVTDADFKTEGIHAKQKKTVTKDSQVICFDAVNFDSVGTKYMVIKEENDDKDGISYDTTAYHVTVNVVKAVDANGKTILSVAEKDGGSVLIHKNTDITPTEGNHIDFMNQYEAEPANVSLSGEKRLVGRTLKAEEFEFLLYETDETYQKIGSAIATAKNKEDAGFTFDRELEFKEAGIYYYVATEKNLGEEGMTYDDTVFGVQIIVTDNEAGKLMAEVQYLKLGDIPEEREGIVFENVYIPNTPEVPDVPEVPVKTESPKTADNTNLALWIAVMFVCGGPLVTIPIRRKREYS